MEIFARVLTVTVLSGGAIAALSLIAALLELISFSNSVLHPL